MHICNGINENVQLPIINTTEQQTVNKNKELSATMLKTVEEHSRLSIDSTMLISIPMYLRRAEFTNTRQKEGKDALEESYRPAQQLQ